MLTSVALVLMMTVPGLGLFYGGMVRKKNVGDTVMTKLRGHLRPRSPCFYRRSAPTACRSPPARRSSAG